MNILHGIDICRIDRIEFNNKKLISRFLHPQELETFNQINDKFLLRKFLASRWAIKEALFKALEYPIAFNKIFIYYQNNRPAINLINYQQVSISLSYEDNLVIASVILVKC